MVQSYEQCTKRLKNENKMKKNKINSTCIWKQVLKAIETYRVATDHRDDECMKYSIQMYL